jgi:hypothetical protein
MRAIFNLYYRETDASLIVEELKQEEFENITVEFVQIVCKQLKEEAQKHTKSWREYGDNALYYTTERSGLLVVWSDRFFLLKGKSDNDSHQLELIDAYNDKSA